MAGMAEFNIVAPGDAISMEAKLDVKPQEPVVQQTAAPDPGVKRTIQCESSIAHEADVAASSLQATASGGGLFAEMFGMACDKLSASMGVEPGMPEPRPEVSGQNANLDPALDAQKVAEIEETKWTQRAELEYNAPNGPGMGGMSA